MLWGNYYRDDEQVRTSANKWRGRSLLGVSANIFANISANISANIFANIFANTCAVQAGACSVQSSVT